MATVLYVLLIKHCMQNTLIGYVTAVLRSKWKQTWQNYISQDGGMSVNSPHVGDAIWWFGASYFA